VLANHGPRLGEEGLSRLDVTVQKLPFHPDRGSHRKEGLARYPKNNNPPRAIRQSWRKVRVPSFRFQFLRRLPGHVTAFPCFFACHDDA